MIEFVERGLYAVLPGAAIFFVFIEQNNKEITFMHLPDNYKLTFECIDLNVFLGTRQLDFVQQLPIDIYDSVVANMI